MIYKIIEKLFFGVLVELHRKGVCQVRCIAYEKIFSVGLAKVFFECLCFGCHLGIWISTKVFSALQIRQWHDERSFQYTVPLTEFG